MAIYFIIKVSTTFIAMLLIINRIFVSGIKDKRTNASIPEDSILLLKRVERKPTKRPGSPCRNLKYAPDTNYHSWRQQRIACDLMRKYNPAVRPKGRDPDKTKKNNGPCLVSTYLDIYSISRVSDALMEFSVQFRFQQQWFDDRLSFSHLQFREVDWIELAEDQPVWNPDTFFQNEKSGHVHTIDKPNVYTKVRYDGRVYYDRRLSLTFACNMHLKTYPHDTQYCDIDFATYAYTTADIEYVWDADPVRLNPEATGSLAKFILLKVTNSSCTSVTNTGTYSCLRVSFKLSRVFSFFLLQLYIPSGMLVVVSYVSYWIDWRASPARVPLSIVTLLTMIAQSNAINSSLPPVSYTKAIDVWISGCIVFIFGSLLEYSVVNFTGIQEDRAKAVPQRESASAKERRMASLLSAPEPEEETPAQERIEMKPTTLLPGSALPMSETGLRHRIKYTHQRSPHYQTLSDAHNRVAPWSCTESIMSPIQIDPLGGVIPNFGRKQNGRRRLGEIRILKLLQKKGRAERLDIISRFLVPILFLGFNIVYWVIFWNGNE